MVAPWKFDVLKTNICPRSEVTYPEVLRRGKVQHTPFEPTLLKYQFESNITRVQDLLDNNGHVLSLNHFPNNFNQPFQTLFWINQVYPNPMKLSSRKNTFSSQTSHDKNKNSANTISTKNVYSVENVFSPPTTAASNLKTWLSQENIH